MPCRIRVERIEVLNGGGGCDWEAVCPFEAIRRDGSVDAGRCTACLACMALCPGRVRVSTSWVC